MGSKDAPEKLQFLGAIKKGGKSVRFYTKRKSGGKTPHIRPSPKQNRSESPCSCIIQELMNRGKYAYMGSWVKYALGKSPCVSKITPVRSKNLRITVSVFLSFATNRFTFENFPPPPTLLYPSIYRYVHIYTHMSKTCSLYLCSICIYTAFFFFAMRHVDTSHQPAFKCILMYIHIC